MQRTFVIRLSRFAAVLAICGMSWTGLSSARVHAATLNDPFGSWSGEPHDNFWNLNYVPCQDGLVAHAQQVTHDIGTGTPGLSDEHLPYSLNLRSIQINGGDITPETTSATVAGTDLTNIHPEPPEYQVYQMAGADGTNSDPVSHTSVFQYSHQDVGTNITSTFERWDHGIRGLLPGGIDDDTDFTGVPSGVEDEDNFGGDEYPSDGSAHDDSQPFTDQIQPCSILPSTTAQIAPNAGGWNNGTVTVTLSALDGAAQALNDSSGQTIESPTGDITQIDYSAARADGSDATSGSISGASGSFTLPHEGVWTVHYRATDVFGNSEPQETTTVQIDETAPKLNITGPSDGASLSVCAGTPTSPTFAPADPALPDGSAGSGVATSGQTFTHGTLVASGVGTYTYSAHATDVAGNTASETRNYSVQYPFTGVLPPLAANGSYRLGSTIPVQFQLLCSGSPITNAVAKLFVSQNGHPPIAATSTANSTTGNLFRYSPTGQLYIFNLETKSLSPGAATLTIQLDDGTSYQIPITLT